MATVTQERFDGGAPVALAVAETDSRTTRDARYHALTDLGAKQRAVYAVVAKYGPLSDRQIGELMGWSVNRVTGRRYELVALGLVEQAGTALDPATDRRVALWQVAA